MIGGSSSCGALPPYRAQISPKMPTEHHLVIPWHAALRRPAGVLGVVPPITPQGYWSAVTRSPHELRYERAARLQL